MTGTTRLVFDEFTARVQGVFETPHLLHDGGALSVEAALARHETHHWPCEELEGVVYRLERKGEVELLAKYVRPDKIDGKYLSDISGQPDVWNWRPNW